MRLRLILPLSLAAGIGAAIKGTVTSLIESGYTKIPVEMALRIKNQETRESALESAVVIWLGYSRAQARAWLAATTDLTPEQKRVQLRRVDENVW